MVFCHIKITCLTRLRVVVGQRAILYVAMNEIIEAEIKSPQRELSYFLSFLVNFDNFFYVSSVNV